MMAPRAVNAGALAEEAEAPMQEERKALAITYFVQAEDGGPVKIGVSTLAGLNSRLASLQCGNPSRLVIRHTLPTNREHELHKHFAHLRLVGEWFQPNEELAELARALLGYEFPQAARVAVHREGYIAGFKAGTDESYTDIAEALTADIMSRVADFASSARSDAEDIAIQRLSEEARAEVAAERLRRAA